MSNHQNRWVRALRSESGSYDLVSVTVYAVMTATLVLSGLFVMFGVVPSTQDGAARDALDPVAAAQSASQSTERRYLAKAELLDKGLLEASGGVETGVDATGTCFVAVSKSKTGKMYFVSNAMPESDELFPGKNPGCVTPPDLAGMVGSLGGFETTDDAGLSAAYHDTSFSKADGNKKVSLTSSGGASQPRGTLNGTLPEGVTFDPSTAEFSYQTSRDADSISAGGSHSCAVTDGELACWGENTFGQIGSGTTAMTREPKMVQTEDIFRGKKVSQVDAGQNHTCAIVSGEAWCWGRNTQGQLGNGTYTDSTVPVRVDVAALGIAPGTTTDISAGKSTTCMIASGAGYCWGSGIGGIRGDGLTGTNGTPALENSVATPVPITSGGVLKNKTLRTISVGEQHTCAVANAKAYCWGSNDSGQLGNKSSTSSSVPQAVDTSGPLKNLPVSSVSAGGAISCAVADATAYCWGSNGNGQLGNGAAAASSNVPVAVLGGLSGRTVTAVSVGSKHSCAAAEDKAYCWGTGTFGVLGNGASTASKVPVLVQAPAAMTGKTVTHISVGDRHTQIVASGSAYGWGERSKGATGSKDGLGALSPVGVSGLRGTGGFPSTGLTVSVTDGATTLPPLPVTLTIR